MCYTSGTTGDPKGVAYTHRSLYLHALGAALPDTLATSSRDRTLVIVPQFHVLAWGIPYTAFVTGYHDVDARPLPRAAAAWPPSSWPPKPNRGRRRTHGLAGPAQPRRRRPERRPLLHHRGDRRRLGLPALADGGAGAAPMD